MSSLENNAKSVYTSGIGEALASLLFLNNNIPEVGSDMFSDVFFPVVRFELLFFSMLIY